MRARASQLRTQGFHARTLARWPLRGYSVPAPQHVKLGVLRRYGHAGGTWVETGTYLGDTTAVLARTALRVHTIEPSADLAQRARQRFVDHPNVTIHEGLSEDLLPGILDTIDGTLSLWLDGHASGGITHTGPVVTPIREELAAIEQRLDRWDSVTVLVDDFRGFGALAGEEGAYPSRSSLVQWADRCGFGWTVEHDIFVAFR
ncbi:MAG: hypothetical protein PHU75_02885 [Candidatus Nanopelagicales bacterium]|nr:hypothetical protein [Candidatus Nanopelagicales bacterium]